ncbi:MAG: WecB/TagA/CpsF family glycosyltransferase, partial [Candidatus Sericytochromatia bacterium]|nr:WecB/TagA/CpsF family glycosyltransferase [Candidatus Tanganyikabacteria bacterium]
LPTTVNIGVGASIDFLAGRVRRAPAWIGRLGLEWLFRLALEPRRLWRRYLLRDLPFLARLLASGGHLS